MIRKKKHDKNLDLGAIIAAKTYQKDDTVAFYEMPFWKKSRQLFAGQFETVKNERYYFTFRSYRFHNIQ